MNVEEATNLVRMTGIASHSVKKLQVCHSGICQTKSICSVLVITVATDAVLVIILVTAAGARTVFVVELMQLIQYVLIEAGPNIAINLHQNNRKDPFAITSTMVVLQGR